jgi:HPt (histidine-containing phosphotransfer) domain-containing protein
MSDYHDREQVRRLQEVMGSDAASIVAPMLAGMTEAIEAIEGGVAAGDLDRVTRAAHAARNDALMLGARPLLEALTELEAASREYDEARAGAALDRVREVWPPTRAELTSLAAPSHP